MQSRKELERSKMFRFCNQEPQPCQFRSKWGAPSTERPDNDVQNLGEISRACPEQQHNLEPLVIKPSHTFTHELILRTSNLPQHHETPFGCELLPLLPLNLCAVPTAVARLGCNSIVDSSTYVLTKRTEHHSRSKF